MGEVFNKLLEFIRENIKGFAILISSVALILAAIGGISYQQWLPITNLNDRIALAFVGVVFLAVALTMYAFERKDRFEIIQQDQYKIAITHPIEGQKGRIFDVRGTFAKEPPGEYRIKVFRIYQNGSYVPIGEADLDKNNKTWQARNCDIAGEVGRRRSIDVYLVGASGLALLDYFNDIQQFHQNNMRRCVAAGIDAGPYLPGIMTKTKDMVKCSSVTVERD